MKKTEPNYFAGFKKNIESNAVYKNTVIISIEPCGANTMTVMKMAENYVRNNHIKKGQIWCVYDKDSFEKSHFNRVEERAKSLNKLNHDIQYHAAWSNECIEIWFILHFDNYKSNNHRQEYIKYLNNKFKSLGLSKYEKNLPHIFEILNEYGNPKKAIRYAKKIIDENYGLSSADIAPGTKVYELVEELAKYLPEEIKYKYL